MNEEQLLAGVINTARWLGWLVAHFRAARTETGWRTPVEADGKGFPDLVLVRDRVLYVELKSERGKPTPEQQHWATVLTAAGATVYLWRPVDYSSGEVERVLRGVEPPWEER